ncbi:MAG TPA: BON domain-containing protein [Armatimonadota bacterium]|nr:BON domain-containing protein [Armatimonadota bacterium]
MTEAGHVEHEVRKALDEDETTAGLDLSVKYVNGVVFLDGAVATAELRAAAAGVAGKVESVAFVRNRLQIKPDHHTTRELFREGEGR